MDFESNAASSAIANPKNKEDLLITIMQKKKQQLTQMMVRVLHMEVIMMDRDGSPWPRLNPSNITSGKLPQKNVVTILAGATSFFASRVIRDSSLSSFHIQFTEPVPSNILKCIIAVVNCTSKNIWTFELIEAEKFVGLIGTHGVVGGGICLQDYVTYILEISFVQCNYGTLSILEKHEVP